MNTFFGHGIPEMVQNFGLAIIPAVMLVGVVIINQLQPSRLKTVVVGATSVVFLILLPYTTYQAMEFKHLLFLDGIADDYNLLAITVFTLMSLFGIVMNVVCILGYANTMAKNVGQHTLLTIGLVVLSVTGATLGQFNIQPITLVTKPLAVLDAIRFIVMLGMPSFICWTIIALLSLCLAVAIVNQKNVTKPSDST